MTTAESDLSPPANSSEADNSEASQSAASQSAIWQSATSAPPVKTGKADEADDHDGHARVNTPWLAFNAHLQLGNGGQKKEKSTDQNESESSRFTFPDLRLRSKTNKSEQSARSKKPDQDLSPDEWTDLHMPEKNSLWSGWEGLCIMLAGVSMPAIIIIMSLLSIPKRMTLVLLNHPVETVVELLLVIGVPVANFLIWRAICKNRFRFSLVKGLALGSAAGTSLLIVVVCIAAVFAGRQLQSEIGSGFGAGFTCLALLFILTSIASIFLANRARLTHDFDKSRQRVLLVTLAGGLLSLIVFAAAEARPWIIRIAEQKTLSNVTAEREDGWKILQALNPEKTILMECSDSRAVGLCGLFLPIKSSTQHQLYFALTGKPYSFKDITNNDLSSMPDDYLSRHVVGDKIPELSVTRSSITGMLHPETLSSTLDWTLVFKNQGQMPQEARAEIGLPPGAVITGMTLWNRGEPEEAAFAASGKAEKYITSNSSQGHDSPAAITDLGHGRMLLHCFPVKDAEELKVRVRMVMPLKPDGSESSTLALPRLIAENFQIENEHQIRLKSLLALSSTSPALTPGNNTDGTQVISGSLTKDQIENANVLISVRRIAFKRPLAILDKIATEFQREQDYNQALAEAQRNQRKLNRKLQEILSINIDASSDVQTQLENLSKALEKKSLDATISPEQQEKLNLAKPKYVVENLSLIAAPAPTNLVIVIDGSATVKEHRDSLIAGLSKIPLNVPTRILMASDEASATNTMSLKQGIEKLKSEKFIGGHDNLKSVVKASELAGETTRGALLWIHGPQPVLNQEIYIMEPYVASPAFYELPLGSGDTDTYDFFKNHTEIGPFSQVPRSSLDVKDDLTTFFSKWAADINGYEVGLTCSTEKPETLIGSKDAQEEVLALYANQQVKGLIAERHIRHAAQIAVAYGLVTPVSCALVAQASNNDTDIDDAALSLKPAEAAVDSNVSVLYAKALPGGVPGTPGLQGATNGTIGTQGKDAVYVTGVNTAGTVRVNNLANLEAMLNIIANISELSMLLLGAITILNSLVSKTMVLELLGQEIEISRGHRVLIGIGMIVIGVALPGMIDWFIASARDANLFS